ncbi:GntR family transcriptional regulator [Streptomyces sp. cmx-4-9]|uniref:GntR family transcriptional regulator n=1 Tax=Streptomyces sp. cmx-4-9 TaxID=2790941 RepID=UPI00397FB43C
MPSPSRGGGPAAMPKYQRIAAALRRDLERAGRPPGGRLPSERSLAERYQVNRQTIRAALQHLRADGLIVTGRRGTRIAGAAAPGAAPRPARTAAPAPAATQCWLTVVTVPPSLAALLDMDGGDRTLVHHQREHGPDGEALQHAVTYLSPGAVARTPELAGYRDRSASARDEDLAPLHRWFERAAARGRLAETLTMTRTTHPQGHVPTCGLSVRRTLRDDAGAILAVTDLAFPSWDSLTFHRDPATEAGFRVT